MDWNGKPYHSLDYELKKRFGTKVYKIALDGGMTCPNRDGKLGTRGCIFCSEGGSGDFAAQFAAGAERIANTVETSEMKEMTDDECLNEAVNRQIAEAISRISHKMGRTDSADTAGIPGTTGIPGTAGIPGTTGIPDVAASGAYIAYFQSFTNTYAPVDYLRKLFTAAISHPDVRVLSIATRPDCLSDEILDLCAELNQIKPVWLELGLQTIHPETAAFIRRGYELDCFTDALSRLRSRGLETIVHVILGLPGETREQMLETVSWLANQDIQGIKLQLLHILRGTDLATVYEQNPFPVMDLDEYLDLVLDCIALLPPELVIHRITGDGPKSLLIAPLWSANKRLVLNSLTRRFKERNITQGCCR